MRPRSLVLALLVATTACSGGSRDRSASTTTPPAERPAALQPAWSRDDLRAVSEPQLVGGRLVLLVHRGGRLVLTGLDPLTGRTAWARRASDAAITRGVAFGPVAVGSRVVYLREQGDGEPHAVLADARTGADVWVSDAYGAYNGVPSPCPRDPAHLCGNGNDEGRGVRFRLRLSDGRSSAPERAGGRELGADLVDPGARDPELVVRQAVRGELWQREASDLFGADVTSDHGWYFAEIGDLVVGHLGLGPIDPEDRPLSSVVLAGIEAQSGRTAWTVPGEPFRCWGGLDEVVSRDLVFRCSYRGRVSGPLGRPAALSGDADVTITGFDPRTGTPTWSHHVGRVPGLALSEGGVMGLGDDVVRLSSSDGTRTVLDVSDGRTLPEDPTAVGWCPEPENDYELVEGGVRFSRAGQQLARPCTGAGTAVEAPAEADDTFGIRTGGRFVWADRDGVHAVQAPTPSRAPGAAG